MSSKIPLISIIIPVFNAEKYLSHCLDCIQNQSYHNFEVICINDGSIDNSERILLDYSKEDSRFIVISITNQGVSNARNIGINYAKGEYIMFIDADDWIEKETLALCINEIDDADILMFPYISEHKSGSRKRVLFKEKTLFTEEQSRILARRLIGPIEQELCNPATLDSYSTIWGKLYSRRIIGTSKFVDLKEIGRAEDTLFNIEVYKRAQQIKYTNEIWYHYRKSNNSQATNKHDPQLTEKFIKLYHYINHLCYSNEEKDALENRKALNTLGLGLNSCYTHKWVEQIQGIRNLLNNHTFKTALKTLKIDYFPFHWKLFFIFAKKRNTIAFWAILRIVKQFVK